MNMNSKAEWVREFLFMLTRNLSDEIDVTALEKSAYENSEVMYRRRCNQQPVMWPTVRR